jgi:uncharacterized protein YozE (UPF0346 family)
MYRLGAGLRGTDELPARTLLTPAEAERAVEETNDAWNTLRNEAYGQSAFPRKDVPIQLQSRILREYDAYRAFVARLTAFDAVTNNYSAELSQWRGIYEILRNQWAATVSSAAPELAPTQGPGGAIGEAVGAGLDKLIWPVLITLGVVSLVKFGANAWMRRSKQPARRLRAA